MTRPPLPLAASALVLLAGVVFFLAADPAPPERWAADVERCLSRICWVSADYLPEPIAVFHEQVLAPRDPTLVVPFLERPEFGGDAGVLDLGTGTGLFALLAAHHGSTRVVATDIAPMAIANTVYNAHRMGFEDAIDPRLVSLSDPGAYTVVKPGERFALVISSPPADDEPAETLVDLQERDEGYEFLLSILEGLPAHLEPGGRLLLLYGTIPGLRFLQGRLKQLGYRANLITAEGSVDFLTHTVRASEDDYNGGLFLPVVEIMP